MPVWPLEDFVVKTGRPKRPRVIKYAQKIEIYGWKAVLGFRAKPFNERHLRRTDNWHHAPTPIDAEERIGFFYAGRENTARSVKLEAATDDSHTVRQQSRRERVTSIALIVFAVKDEVKRPRPIDAPSVCNTIRLIH